MSISGDPLTLVAIVLGVLAPGIFAVAAAVCLAVVPVVHRHAGGVALGARVCIGLQSLHAAYVQRRRAGTATTSGSEKTSIHGTSWRRTVLVAAGLIACPW